MGQCQCSTCIETSQLMSTANEQTGFCMTETLMEILTRNVLMWGYLTSYII